MEKVMRKDAEKVEYMKKCSFIKNTMICFVKKKIVEPLKSKIKECYETQKEFDEQIKRTDEMEERMNHIMQIKLDIKRSIKEGKSTHVTATKKITNQPTVYDKKVDVSRYLRKESDVDSLFKVRKVLDSLQNSAPIQDNRLGLENTIKEKKTIQIPEESTITDKKESVKTSSMVGQEVEGNLCVAKTGSALKQEEKCEDIQKKKTKKITFNQALSNVKAIDAYVQKNENSKDLQTLLNIRRYLDTREVYILKMKKSLLIAMCQFNEDIRAFRNSFSQESMDALSLEKYRMSMNKKYNYFNYLYTNYFKEEEIGEVLGAIEVKVDFINRRMGIESKEQEIFPCVKKKVA